MVGIGQMVSQETVKNWRFAEPQWYCADCGIVSASEVQKEETTSEEGICRCGQEISQTTF